MEHINLNIYRDETKPEDVNVLKNIVKEHITDKGGSVSFPWNMQQCGYSLWYDCSGYIETPEGTVSVSIRYTSR